ELFQTITDWGCFKKVVMDTHELWAILGEIKDGDGLFVGNMISLVEAYKEERLVGIRYIETDELYEKNVRGNTKLFTRPTELSGLTMYLVPAFCVLKKDHPDTAEMFWVHPRIRGYGFGRALVEVAGIKKADHVLEDAHVFWTKC